MSEAPPVTGRIRRLDDGSFETTLRHVLEGHDSAAVWRLLTDSSCLAQWLAPGSIDPRKGGRAHIDFADSGTVIDSEVLQFDAPRVLEYSWSSGDEPLRRLRWELHDIDGGTCLDLTVSTPAGEDVAKACAGFEGHLVMLAAALEGVPIKFPFDLFMQARAAYSKQLGQ